MDLLKESYTILGGVGLFIYGLKLIGGPFQFLADRFVRKILNLLPSSTLLSVFVGIVLTIVAQSSILFSISPESKKVLLFFSAMNFLTPYLLNNFLVKEIYFLKNIIH